MIDQQIVKAVSEKRAQLEALTLRQVGSEFEAMYQIAPNLNAGKESLIERVLAKFQAELQRKAA